MKNSRIDTERNVLQRRGKEAVEEEPEVLRGRISERRRVMSRMWCTKRRRRLTVRGEAEGESRVE